MFVVEGSSVQSHNLVDIFCSFSTSRREYLTCQAVLPFSSSGRPSPIQGTLEFQEASTFDTNEVLTEPDTPDDRVKGGAIYNAESGLISFSGDVNMESNKAGGTKYSVRILYVYVAGRRVGRFPVCSITNIVYIQQHQQDSRVDTL